MKAYAILGLAMAAWAGAHPHPTADGADTLDALIVRLADPSLGQATPDGLRATLSGAVDFDPAPSAMVAPFCTTSLPAQPDMRIADGIASFTATATGSTCPAPRLHRLALRIATPAATPPDHVIALMRDQLGPPADNNESDGLHRVAWRSPGRTVTIEYDPEKPRSAEVTVTRHTL